MESETVWRALASPHRRRILDLLRDGPRSTGQLAKEVPELSRFAVMQHLTVLEEAGLVLARREGRLRYNFRNPIPLREIYERWVDPPSSTAAETALHLKRYAESKNEVSREMDQDSFRLVKLELEMRINAPREKVYAALTEEYNDWWPHRYKPDSKVFFESAIGGRVGEQFSNGGGALYGYVAYLDAPYKIVTTGMGSMSRGSVGFGVETLTEEEGLTLYRRELSIWGSVPPELEQMFREGSRQIMEDALRGYLEKGVKYVAPEGGTH